MEALNIQDGHNCGNKAVRVCPNIRRFLPHGKMTVSMPLTKIEVPLLRIAVFSFPSRGQRSIRIRIGHCSHRSARIEDSTPVVAVQSTSTLVRVKISLVTDIYHTAHTQTPDRFRLAKNHKSIRQTTSRLGGPIFYILRVVHIIYLIYFHTHS